MVTGSYTFFLGAGPEWRSVLWPVLCDTIALEEVLQSLFLDKAVGVSELEWWHHPCCPPEGPGQAGVGIRQEAVQFSKDSWTHAALQKSARKHPLTPVSEIRIHWSTRDNCFIRGDQHHKERANKQSNQLAHAEMVLTQVYSSAKCLLWFFSLDKDIPWWFLSKRNGWKYITGFSKPFL